MTRLEEIKDRAKYHDDTDPEDRDYLFEQIAALTAEIVRLDMIYNPCNHSPVESISCGVCGYPNPAKLIAALTAKVEYLQKDNTDRYTRIKELEEKIKTMVVFEVDPDSEFAKEAGDE